MGRTVNIVMTTMKMLTSKDCRLKTQHRVSKALSLTPLTQVRIGDEISVFAWLGFGYVCFNADLY